MTSEKISHIITGKLPLIILLFFINQLDIQEFIDTRYRYIC